VCDWVCVLAACDGWLGIEVCVRLCIAQAIQLWSLWQGKLNKVEGFVEQVFAKCDCAQPDTLLAACDAACNRASVTQVEVLICRVWEKSSQPVARANKYLAAAAQDMKIADAKPLISPHIRKLMDQ
jgi:hypothetical protein